MSKVKTAQALELVTFQELPEFTLKREEMKEGLLMWSGPVPVPQIGDTVRLRINSIGLGLVESYASYGGYLGLMVRPIEPPQWWRSQQGCDKAPYPAALAFGAEIALVKEV